MSILKVDNVQKTYSGKNGGSSSNAIKGISFTVDKGEFWR